MCPKDKLKEQVFKESLLNSKLLNLSPMFINKEEFLLIVYMCTFAMCFVDYNSHSESDWFLYKLYFTVLFRL